MVDRYECGCEVNGSIPVCPIHQLPLCGNVSIVSRQLYESKIISLLNDTKNSLTDIQKLVGGIDTLTNKNAHVNKRVLVIDDDATTRMLARAILENDNIEVFTSADWQCTDIITSKNPDLILLDIYMPGIQGTDVALALTKEPRIVKGLVYFHSNTDMNELELLAKKYNADGYLCKDLKPDRFSFAVRCLLDIADMRNLKYG